ncbi:short-chain collagen C4-like [Mytilus californianus]|uniref:short-chain collagen C4-like n=1 Tax=Mytilus californianus TaxID=6549 RepID=UPI00224691A5|nr:short-chain collagen C4-like [Mytilus californianus]
MGGCPTGSVYIQWGRKLCTRNGTELVYSGIGGGGFLTNRGRSATPVCVPHDPDLGPVSSTGGFSTIYGMEYNDAVFGNNLYDKDVPCAVCRAIHVTSVFMVPGKLSCYKGWNLEYKGLLASGNRVDNGASTYICIDDTPEVLEAGVQNDNGYILFPVKAYCGSLKCPPYVQNSIFNCVVCSK